MTTEEKSAERLEQPQKEGQKSSDERVCQYPEHEASRQLGGVVPGMLFHTTMFPKPQPQNPKDPLLAVAESDEESAMNVLRRQPLDVVIKASKRCEKIDPKMHFRGTDDRNKIIGCSILRSGDYPKNPGYSGP